MVTLPMHTNKNFRSATGTPVAPGLVSKETVIVTCCLVGPGWDCTSRLELNPVTFPKIFGICEESGAPKGHLPMIWGNIEFHKDIFVEFACCPKSCASQDWTWWLELWEQHQLPITTSSGNGRTFKCVHLDPYTHHPSVGTSQGKLLHSHFKHAL